MHADHPFLEPLIREFRGETSKALNAVIQTPGFALLILTPSVDPGAGRKMAVPHVRRP